MPKLANQLGKTIWVSLPKLYQGGEPRAFTLVGVEECGLWLQSDNEEVLAATARVTPVLIPFAQIAYITFAAATPPAAAVGAAKQPVTGTRSKEDKNRNETRRKR
jgi:hypothetical protein